MFGYAQYIFLQFIQLPSFFGNGFVVAVFLWFGGIYCVGFIYGLIS